jgi:hypothetical protein
MLCIQTYQSDPHSCPDTRDWCVEENTYGQGRSLERHVESVAFRGDSDGVKNLLNVDKGMKSSYLKGMLRT